LDATLLNLAGVRAAEQGQTAEAERFWRQAIALGPPNTSVHFNLGVTLAASGRMLEALEQYQHAVRLDPGNAAAFANLALLHEKLGDPDAAERNHRTAAALSPDNPTIRFNLANWLAASNLPDAQQEAKAAFLELLKTEPQHLGAWNNLGTLLFETGYVSAAETAFTAATTYHPNDLTARINLGNVLLHKNALDAARNQFTFALHLQPDQAEAHQGLASCFSREGDEVRAALHRLQGFGRQPITTLSYRGQGRPIPLLILATAQEGNIPWRFLVDRNRFHSTILAMEHVDPELPLPPHALIFNAIGDADRCAEGLRRAQQFAARSKAPLINAPHHVLRTGRQDHAQRLAGITGLTVPRIMALAVSGSQAVARELERSGFRFPLLLRAPGFHGGHFFLRVEAQEFLEQALDELPGKEVLAIEWLDTRGPDGLYRKFRMMRIGGQLLPIHLALSSQWKVHYFSSDMAKDAAYRAEEAAFLGDPATFLGAPAMATLAALGDAIDLDYFGMDFCLGTDGNILLFEANATMVLHPPTHEALWDYRRAATERAVQATRRLFIERSGPWAASSEKASETSR
jgi:tetratricopeptide (TPR) repeat protein